MARFRLVSVALLVAGLLASPVGSAVGESDEVAIAAKGQGSGTARFIDQRDNPPGPQSAKVERGPLDIGGEPPAATPRGDKMAELPAAPSGAGIGNPNSNGPTTLPNLAVSSNFAGVDKGSTAGTAALPDSSASVGTTQIMQTANGRVAVYNKAGVQLCTNTLAAWLGVPTAEVFAPRTLFDSIRGRFIIIATTAGTAGAPPKLFLAATTTVNACEGYNVYSLTFRGSLFGAGAMLDFPYLGQDQTAILASTNNFNPGYVNSTAWSVAKEKLYAGSPVEFPVFAVSFSAAPVTVTGVPLGATDKAYFVAGVPGTGYRLYRMTNTAGSRPKLVLQATIAADFVAPPRRASQCPEAGEAVVDPGDGRLAAPPVQAVSSPYIWFTHGVDLHGFPTVRYGVINTETNAVYSTVAFHGPTSDDFNPSIAAFEESPNGFYVWLNWAYTDTGASPCVSASATMSAVTPGAGVPALIANDLPLAHGSPSSVDARFGGFSSVHVDSAPVGPPAGRTAVLSQQYFVNGTDWATRIVRVSFVP